MLWAWNSPLYGGQAWNSPLYGGQAWNRPLYGLEQSLIWRPGLEPSLIWRPGAKLLLGLTVSLIRRNRPLSWEAVNFLVLPKHVFYSAPGEPHQYICPLPSPQEENGVFNFSGVYAVHPVCHLSGVRQGHTTDADPAASFLLSK